MELQKIYGDSDFQNVVVPEGYLLVFLGYSTGAVGGEIVKRYKNHNNEFGTLAGGSTGDVTDSEAAIIITAAVSSAEDDAKEVADSLVSATALSEQLDAIIG